MTDHDDQAKAAAAMDDTNPQVNNDPEKIIWQGGPSQMLNYNRFFTAGLIFLVILLLPKIYNLFFVQSLAAYKSQYMLASKIAFFLPPIYVLYHYLRIRTHRYIITTQRLSEEYGILNRVSEKLELFRVKDITLSQPFAIRMFGCGNIILDTSDKSTPIVVLQAIKDPNGLIDKLQRHVEIMRIKKGVREID